MRRHSRRPTRKQSSIGGGAIEATERDVSGVIDGPGPVYDAFVSYRRSDGTVVAQWIRREIESFRAPKRVRERFDRRLKVYLDTAYERGSSDFYEQNIRPALLASRHLIVVATRDAVRRPGRAADWIQRELDDFAGGPNGANIIVARANGELLDPLPADLAARFPNLEIIDLRGAGRFWYLMPLRSVRLANEKIKLIAPLTDLRPVDMPLLRQEEERRQQGRLGAAIGASLAILVAVSAFAALALRSRMQAEAALESSLFASGRTVLSVSAQIAHDGPLAQLRSEILNESCDLIDTLRAQATREAGIAELTACSIERAMERERQGETEAARAVLNGAVSEAATRNAAGPSIQSAVALLDARRTLAAFLRRHDQPAESADELRRLVADADAWLETFDYDAPFQLAGAGACEELASLAEDRGRYDEAIAAIEEAERRRRAVETSLVGEEAAATARKRGELLERAAMLSEGVEPPDGVARRYVAAAEAFERAHAAADPADLPDLPLREAGDRGRAALFHAKAGQADVALVQARAALQRLDMPRDGSGWQAQTLVDSAALYALVASIEAERGDRDAAATAVRQGLEDLREADSAGIDAPSRERAAQIGEALRMIVASGTSPQ